MLNKLYFGDNLPILRENIADESVDLIYLDPPFNSNATYNVLFRERSGDESAAQITAFEDTWRWSSQGMLTQGSGHADSHKARGIYFELTSRLRDFIRPEGDRGFAFSGYDATVPC